METTSFIWKNGEFVPWEQAVTHVLTHSLHYGGAAFEGIRCYKTPKGTALFRLKEHIERLFYSAGILQMDIPYAKEEIQKACVETVLKNKLQEGYVRPLIYFGYGKMGLNPKGAPVDCAVACWPWGQYLGEEMVALKTSTYIRIHPQSTVCDAKISGHYVNSTLASLEVYNTKYHEALFLDYQGNVAEGPGENIFIVKNKTLFTPPAGTILMGITRDTVLRIAKSRAVPFEEKTLAREDVYRADEAFFTGTAAEVTPIKSLDDNVIGTGALGEVTAIIKNAFHDITRGKDNEFERFLTYA